MKRDLKFLCFDGLVSQTFVVVVSLSVCRESYSLRLIIHYLLYQIAPHNK